MFGVNNIENNSNETLHEDSRDSTEANSEVFLNIPESTVKKRKMDKGRVKCPRLSSFNMSSLRLSSSNSESSKGATEGSFLNTNEESEELRCSPMVLENISPVFIRKKLSSYSLTPYKPLNKKSKTHDSSSSDNFGVHDHLCVSDSINDSNKSLNEVLDTVNIMQEPVQMKTEQLGTPHDFICPPGNCPQRPSKVRRSDGLCGGERSCRLLFTKSDDAMKDGVTSYGCEAGTCISQTSEKPITPSEFGTELEKGVLRFDVQASGSKIIEPVTPEINKDIIPGEYMDIEKSTTQNEFNDKLLKETLNPNIQAFDFDIKPIISVDFKIEPITYVKKEKDLNSLDFQKVSHSPSMTEKDKVLSQNQNLYDIDKSDKLSSPKSVNDLDLKILKNDGKNVIGLSTPILKVDIDYPQCLATPTHDQQPSKSNNWVSIPSVAPVLSSNKYLGNFVESGVKLLLTPTDSPINTPGSGSSCNCSCTECDFSPPSGARAKMMSQTIESNNDTDNEIQIPDAIEAVENNALQSQENEIMYPMILKNNTSQNQENAVDLSGKSYVKKSTSNESLTSTPKDLTPLSTKSNITVISGVSPLPASTPRPKHKHKHVHHHCHHHHKHHQSIHHLTVHSNSYHHMTSDGDILITSTPLNRQNLVELVKEDISSVVSDIDSGNSDYFGKPSRFVMSDLCGSDQSANQFGISNNLLIGNSTISDESKKNPSGGGAIYIKGNTETGSFELMDNKESPNNSQDNCKLHLGTDTSPGDWMIDESIVLPRRASSVDETLFRVLSQESPVCLSLN